MDTLDGEQRGLLDLILHFHGIPKASRDQDWLSGRRDVLSRLHALRRGQDLQLATLRLDLARAVRAVLDKGQPGSSQAVVLADFTNEALERLRAKEEETAAAAASSTGSERLGAKGAGAHGGFQPAETVSAREKYLAYFLKVLWVLGRRSRRCSLSKPPGDRSTGPVFG